MTIKTKKKPAQLPGTIETKVEYADKDSGKSHSKEAVREVDPPRHPGDHQVMGEIVFGKEAKMSRKFQSTGITVMARIPWPFTPGDKEAIAREYNDGVTFIAGLVGDVVAEEALELPDVIAKLLE